jgi:hypothetical protein
MFGRAKDDDTARHQGDTMTPQPVHTSGHDDDTRVVDARAGHDPEQDRRDRFGGINWGAGFFGWLVAVAVSLLLTGIIGAVGAGAGVDEEMLPDASTAEIGLLAVLTLTVVLVVGYYAGGYVAGRMSRYDGPRQGLAVWVIGLLVTLVAVAAGAFFGDQYNALSRVDLPTVPLSSDALTTSGIVLAAVLLLGTLVAAMLGGGVGRHYHARVDRAGH